MTPEPEKSESLDQVPPEPSKPTASSHNLATEPVEYDDTTRRRIAYWMMAILTSIVVVSFAYLFLRTHSDCDDCRAPVASPSVSVGLLLPNGTLQRVGYPSDGGLLIAAWELSDGGLSAAPPPPPQDVVSGIGNAVARPPSQAVANLIGLMTILFGPLITLIGTVMGFYFGGKSGISNAANSK